MMGFEVRTLCDSSWDIILSSYDEHLFDQSFKDFVKAT